MLRNTCIVLSLAAVNGKNLREGEGVQRKLEEGVQRKLEAVGPNGNGQLFPTCVAGSLVATEANTRLVYAGLRTDFYAIIAQIISGDPNSPGAPGVTATAPLNLAQKQYRVANILGSAARLVFHDAGEFDVRTLDKFGIDGCLSHTGPNSGLMQFDTLPMTLIEGLYQKYCTMMGRADFWVLFGKIAIESALPNGRFAAFAGIAPAIVAGQTANPTLTLPFQWGRKDATASCDGGADRLPAHQPGLSEFTKTYVNQMGLTTIEGIVLNGAHTIGHVHTQYSGFGFNDVLLTLEQNPQINAWDESPFVFDNLYYDSLANELWLNNDAQLDQIGNPPNNNADANFWAVQGRAGIQADVPLCSIQVPPTCGLVGLVNPQFFCDVQVGAALVRRVGTTGRWQDLARYFNTNLANPCNCAEFFARPVNPAPKNCALAPHPKTIMLNSDMAQSFPIEWGNGPVGGSGNQVIGGSGTVSPTNPKGLLKELCSVAVVSRTATNFAKYPKEMFPGNTVVQNAAGIWQTTSFGCVSNTIGDGQPGNKQTIISTKLVTDPNAPSVSLFAYVLQFVSAAIVNTCTNGISLYDPTAAVYGGKVFTPLKPPDWIGRNDFTKMVGTCVDAIPALGAGRDNFYRAFEKAWVKMVSVGYSVDTVTRPKNSNKLGDLKSICFVNANANVNTPACSSTCLPEDVSC